MIDAFIDLFANLLRFPLTLLEWAVSLLVAFLSDIDTFAIAAGFVVLGFVVGPLIAIGAGLVTYGLVRVYSAQGAISHELNFIGRVIRDNVRSLEVKVKPEDGS